MKKYYVEPNSDKYLASIENSLNVISKMAGKADNAFKKRQINKSKKIYIDIFYKFIKG
jgi:hypothetical protein